MFFQAEYQFSGAKLKSGVRYFAVVEARGGRKAHFPLPALKPGSGTLPGMKSRFRPGDGPFQGYVESWQMNSRGAVPGTGKRVSNVVPLR